RVRPDAGLRDHPATIAAPLRVVGGGATRTQGARSGARWKPRVRVAVREPGRLGTGADNANRPRPAAHPPRPLTKEWKSQRVVTRRAPFGPATARCWAGPSSRPAGLSDRLPAHRASLPAPLLG